MSGFLAGTGLYIFNFRKMKFAGFASRIIIFLLLFSGLDFAASKFMLKGLNKFYGFDKKPEILINGSSMSLSGFHKTAIESQVNQKVAIYAKEGVGIEDRYAMLQQFFLDHQGSVKTVIYEVNPLLFSDKLTAANVYTIFYPYMDNKAIDEYIHNRAGSLEYYAHKYCRASRFDVLTINFALKGYMNNYDNLKTNAINPETAYFSKEEHGKKMVDFNKEKMAVFEKTMKLLQDNNTKVVMVMMPIYYQKRATFDSASFSQLDLFYKGYAESNRNMYYLDLNTNDLTHNASIFSDVLHLNREGQKKVTESVVNFLK